ncbi:DNA-directed RNA polymerase III subunit RPC5 [Intoshia linei]|uniref:DNA-directed RNA polymerase III subunit RPC5 n=1 Tax=Intoshia linei TaxID=1819745 RepID=A0A177B8U8_9BILA|nr:DNA-directed RNA polymerase III subunit RPC5 [Intoshia linei]
MDEVISELDVYLNNSDTLLYLIKYPETYNKNVATMNQVNVDVASNIFEFKCGSNEYQNVNDNDVDNISYITRPNIDTGNCHYAGVISEDGKSINLNIVEECMDLKMKLNFTSNAYTPLKSNNDVITEEEEQHFSESDESIDIKPNKEKTISVKFGIKSKVDSFCKVADWKKIINFESLLDQSADNFYKYISYKVPLILSNQKLQSVAVDIKYDKNNSILQDDVYMLSSDDYTNNHVASIIDLNLATIGVVNPFIPHSLLWRSKLDVSNQIINIISSAKIAVFRKLTEKLSINTSSAIILKVLEKVAVNIQGNWVVNSQYAFKYESEMENIISTVDLEDSRNYLLWKLNLFNSITRKSIGNQVNKNFVNNYLDKILHDIAVRNQVNNTWVLKETRDELFLSKFSKIIKKENKKLENLVIDAYKRKNVKLSAEDLVHLKIETDGSESKRKRNYSSSSDDESPIQDPKKTVENLFQEKFIMSYSKLCTFYNSLIDSILKDSMTNFESNDLKPKIDINTLKNDKTLLVIIQHFIENKRIVKICINDVTLYSWVYFQSHFDQIRRYVLYYFTDSICKNLSLCPTTISTYLSPLHEYPEIEISPIHIINDQLRMSGAVSNVNHLCNYVYYRISQNCKLDDKQSEISLMIKKKHIFSIMQNYTTLSNNIWYLKS